MGNYGHEISEKENRERLSLIDMHKGLCPVCNRKYITRIEDELHPHGFYQGRHIFLCDDCGVVARKDVNYIPSVGSTVYFFKYGHSPDIKK